nr:LuxR family transcriptional regulator [Rhodoferax sp.]
MHTERHTRRDINRPALVAAVEALGEVSSPNDFVAWTQGEFNRAFPHGAFMACIGKVFDNGVKPMTMVSFNCPDTYLRSARQAEGIYSTFRMQQWMQSGEPQLFDLLRDAAALDEGCLKDFQASGLQNIAAHGLYDVTREHLSFFSFHQLPHPPRAEQEKSLKMIVPAMHAALLRCLPGHFSTAQPLADTPPPLTARETEVLSWIRQGKTNGEIAAILGISPHTVKNQVKSVMVKLRVNTRGQAVVEGMRKRHIALH